MNTPKALRKQLKEYESAGFHAVGVEHRAGSHWKVTFAEFDEPQILTQNIVDWRSTKNNIARFRRLMKESANV